jgi:MFS family permease
MTRPGEKVVLLVIVAAQFCGTSLWFAGNAVLPQLQSLYHWPLSSLGFLTASVQLGFIIGTLLFAILGIADKFSPSKVFFWSCFAAGVSNLLIITDASSFALTVLSRCLTGFFLAGIYPVGMKIAADWQEKGLGNWLGILVGALVLGTSFPHALKLMPQFASETTLLLSVSGAAVMGGLLLYLVVPDGPYRKPAVTFSFAGIREAFQLTEFRSPAFGYFGHMWELYAFWAFIPTAIILYSSIHNLAIPSFWSFLIIAIGMVGCIVGGYLSKKMGSTKVAYYALIISGLCCVLSPFIFNIKSETLFLFFMLIWGVAVITDSPQFSALVARTSPPQVRGSAITIVTCIGFAITIVSIQLVSFLVSEMGKYIFLLLAPGPLLGILSMNYFQNKSIQR